jgi:hypothetical protein
MEAVLLLLVLPVYCEDAFHHEGAKSTKLGVLKTQKLRVLRGELSKLTWHIILTKA